jgi:hypothetical protein
MAWKLNKKSSPDITLCITTMCRTFSPSPSAVPPILHTQPCVYQFATLSYAAHLFPSPSSHSISVAPGARDTILSLGG